MELYARFRLALFLFPVVTACQAPGSVVPVELQVTPQFADVSEGATVVLEAVVTSSDGTRGPTDRAEWRSSDELRATVSNGTVTGHRPGRVTIFAGWAGMRPSATLEVRAASVDAGADGGIDLCADVVRGAHAACARAHVAFVFDHQQPGVEAGVIAGASSGGERLRGDGQWLDGRVCVTRSLISRPQRPNAPGLRMAAS